VGLTHAQGRFHVVTVEPSGEDVLEPMPLLMGQGTVRRILVGEELDRFGRIEDPAVESVTDAVDARCEDGEEIAQRVDDS